MVTTSPSPPHVETTRYSATTLHLPNPISSHSSIPCAACSLFGIIGGPNHYEYVSLGFYLVALITRFWILSLDNICCDKNCTGFVGVKILAMGVLSLSLTPLPHYSTAGFKLGLGCKSSQVILLLSCERHALPSCGQKKTMSKEKELHAIRESLQGYVHPILW